MVCSCVVREWWGAFRKQAAASEVWGIGDCVGGIVGYAVV